MPKRVRSHQPISADGTARSRQDRESLIRFCCNAAFSGGALAQVGKIMVMRVVHAVGSARPKGGDLLWAPCGRLVWWPASVAGEHHLVSTVS